MSVTKPAGLTTLPVLQQIDYKKKNKYYHKRHNYRAGGRYNKAPSNWRHHYKKRPGDWQRRGCVIVGPVW